jgi:hypothetical protein
VGILRNISHVLAGLFNDRADFQRRWEEAVRTGAPQPWAGEWVSEVNGHRGELKCLLTQTAPGKFDAAFYAVFARLLKVSYHVPLQGRQTEGVLKLEGQTDLGKLAGGIYHYEGEMDEASLRCTYRCAYDHGVFHLTPLRR